MIMNASLRFRISTLLSSSSDSITNAVLVEMNLHSLDLLDQTLERLKEQGLVLHEMRGEQQHLQDNVDDLVQRNVMLNLLLQEAEKRERRHLQERNRLRHYIAGLQGLLDRENRLMPSSRTSGIQSYQ